MMLRLRRNLRQEDLAAMTDLTQRTISMIETGRQRPRAKTLRKLGEALDVELRDLDREFAVGYEPRPRISSASRLRWRWISWS